MDKISQLFVKTFRQDPKDEAAINAKLLIRAGYIHKEMAGVYAYLPLGLKVVEKIKAIVREEMNSLGGQELTMTTLQRKEIWEKTDRWDDKKVDVWFKSKLASGAEVGFGWSHEEQITEMMKSFITSYRDLPLYVYQFQNKLRNELRAKSGIMRCREFVMKDMYSYSKNDTEHKEFYNKVTQAYLNIFKKVGLGDRTFLTFASGGAFTQFSHEFQTISEAGEDTIYIDRDKNIAINEEVFTDEVINQLNIDKEKLEKVTAAEVGNIFDFGSQKSEQMGLVFTDEDGTVKPVILGSYGIGITRLMGVIVELFHDEKGIIWPETVAPYTVEIVDLLQDGTAEALAKEIEAAGVSTVIDDRDISTGQKLADADLFGMPWRIVVSSRNQEQGGVAIKRRSEDEEKIVPVTQAIAEITKRTLE